VDTPYRSTTWASVFAQYFSGDAMSKGVATSAFMAAAAATGTMMARVMMALAMPTWVYMVVTAGPLEVAGSWEILASSIQVATVAAAVMPMVTPANKEAFAARDFTPSRLMNRKMAQVMAARNTAATAERMNTVLALPGGITSQLMFLVSVGVVFMEGTTVVARDTTPCSNTNNMGVVAMMADVSNSWDLGVSMVGSRDPWCR